MQRLGIIDIEFFLVQKFMANFCLYHFYLDRNDKTMTLNHFGVFHLRPTNEKTTGTTFIRMSIHFVYFSFGVSIH
jgi:hypothetical protein